MHQEIKTHKKIKILLVGDLVSLNKDQISSWFKEAFEWVDRNEKYLLGAKLVKIKNHWEEQIKEKDGRNYVEEV